MWPWGHLGLGYVLFSALLQIRGRRPQDFEVLAVVVGTQFPDIIDKPLAWSFGVLPTGRSFAHSLLTMILVLSVVFWYTREYEPAAVSTAFGSGYVSHLLGDSYHVIFSGEISDASFLLWPVFPSPSYPTEKSFIAHFLQLEPSPQVLAGIGLFLLAVGLWFRQGKPGFQRFLVHFLSKGSDPGQDSFDR